MKRIRSAIALSDLHLGKKESYLYSKDANFQNNRKALIDLLKKLGPQDEIVLLGDFLELSLAGLDEVYSDAKTFFALLAEAGPVRRIVYVPGNHDHHFWRSLAEQVHINGKIHDGQDPPCSETYPYCFVDERFSSKDKKLPCRIILEDLWPKKKKKPEFVVKYPHHLIEVVSEEGEKIYYLFTHGHFFEDLFKPINFLIEPAHLEELEAFNNGWLEFFDYHLGHAGKLSEEVKKIEKNFQEGDTKAKKTIRNVLKEIYKSLVQKLHLRCPWTCVLKCGIKLVQRWILKKTPMDKKSGLFGVPSIDDKLKRKIADYIENYILKRYRKGKAEDYYFPTDADIPKPFTLVFGHTHRPIRGEETSKAEVSVDGITYPLANTGGWISTDGTGAANGENAGILLIDKKGARWETLEGQLQKRSIVEKD